MCLLFGKDHVFPTKTSDLRNGPTQMEYRKKLNVKGNEKHCAHYVSLEIALFINNQLKNKLCCCKLDEVLNRPRNYRMVKKEINLTNHRTMDGWLMKLWDVIIQVSRSMCIF